MSLELMKRETATEISSSEAFLNAINELSYLEQTIPTIKVVDGASQALASETRMSVRNVEKALENMRKLAGAPYRTMQKTINNLFKPLVEACGRMREILDGQLLEYKAQEEARIEAEQKAAMEKEIEAKEAGAEIVAEVQQFENVVETDSATTYTTSRKKVEVVDKVKLIKAALDGRNQIPVDVIEVNEAKLRQVATGRMYKPKQWAKYGVRVWKEDSVVQRGK